MLSVALGTAKYYTHNFKEINWRRIEEDKKTFAKVKECLGAFATGQFTLTGIQRKMFSLKLSV